MDSINKNQKEDNLKDVYGQEAIEKIKELAKKAGSFFSAQRSDREAIPNPTHGRRRNRR
jgi:hypothetical protein